MWRITVSIDFYRFWMTHISKTIFSNLIPGYLFGKFIFIFLYITGIVALIIKKNFRLLILLLVPIILHSILSSFFLYPFDLRLILYNAPLIIILITFGINYYICLASAKFKNTSLSQMKNSKQLRYLMLIIPLIISMNFIRTGFPIQHEEIMKSVGYIQKNMSANDKIYVYHGTTAAYRYYCEIKYINFPKEKVIYGNSYWDKKDKGKYLNDVSTLHGKIWLLFTHVYNDEKSYILDGLDSLGIKRLEKYNSFGSDAYLYDFGK